MADLDPRVAVRDFVSAPRMAASDATSGGGGWHTQLYQGGLQAHRQSVTFVKERSTARRRIYALHIADAEGRTAQWVIAVGQDDDGTWHVEGGAGGAGPMPAPPAAPRVNLGGGGWPSAFYAGGSVLDADDSVAHVRLVAANGTTMGDSVDGGVVLFITEQQVDVPLRAELYDRSGSIVREHQVFG